MDPEPPNPSKFTSSHSTIPPQTMSQWTKQQQQIRQKIIEVDTHGWTLDTIQLIAGVDLSANKNQPNLACAALVVYNVKFNRVEYEDYEIVRISQGYVPGFLAFREVPALWNLFQKLKVSKPEAWPELLIVDGNGILHQNQCGLACHLGVLLDLPTLGVGKTLFYIDGLGKEVVKKICEDQIKKQNDYALLKGDSGRIWGAGLRNGKTATNPVFVSVGHKIGLETAIQCVILSSIHRVPEPVRLADKKSRQLIQSIDPKSDIKNYPKYNMIFLNNLHP